MTDVILPKNEKELREELLKVFVDLKSGDLDRKVGADMIRASREYARIIKLKMEYDQANRVKPNIKFMEND